MSKSGGIVAVIGASTCNSETYDIAYTVGYHLGLQGCQLICGGLGGVMAAACEGAKTAGGNTIGILPGTDPCVANPWVDSAIATGMGEARNAIIVHTAQALIAIAGEYGTLSEIAFALKLGKPIIGLHTWQPTYPGQNRQILPRVTTPEAAVEWVLDHLNSTFQDSGTETI